jgi:hypothetical protein
MAKVEIIPPDRSLAKQSLNGIATVARARTNPGGLVSSTLTRWEANGQTRAISAVAERTRAEADLFEAHTQALESYVKRQAAAARVEELPEIIAAERARRRAARAEELRQMQHNYDFAQLRRQTELARAEAILEDARQALIAQREHGVHYHGLGWKQKNGERELYVEEQQAILSEHRKRVAQSELDGLQHASNEELLQRRTEMNADGRDTRAVDEELARRNNSAPR